MPSNPAPRPAHRPSRRADIVAAGVDLFKVQAPEIVTVADIAERAGMTSAAFYYHFGSKEELLEELVRTFAGAWVAAVVERLRAMPDLDHLGDFTDAVLDWIEEHESEALVFFTSSVGSTPAVDRCRAESRQQIAQAASEAVARITATRRPAQAGAAAVALFVLLASAARSQLTTDEVFRTLGRTRFRREVQQLAHSIVGPAKAAAGAPRARRTAAGRTSA
jgi:AcrR family transcriptional regulator